ncbi:MAG TPA: hypothetical protein PK379_03240 [Candidatus Hydrogenedentes bacterium]|nr:hypothetical protein [Candidatus Hydrogenedentota bacterium]HOK89020.1 hypothetical protein [Candidatus Hydrogenedentota bacterium]
MQNKGVLTAASILIDGVGRLLLLPIEMILRLIVLPFYVISAMFDPTTP